MKDQNQQFKNDCLEFKKILESKNIKNVDQKQIEKIVLMGYKLRLQIARNQKGLELVEQVLELY